MRGTRLSFAALLVVSLSPRPAPAAGADDIQLELQVDRPRPAADETVQLTYVFRGTASASSIRMPSSLPLKNLRIVGGPATSTSINFINGDLSKSFSVTWFLRPLGPGPGEVGETVWGVGDRTLKGHAYLLEIGPPRRQGGNAGSRPNEEEDPTAVPPLGAPPFPGFRSQGFERRQRQEPVVLYSVTPDRTTAYVGEEIVLHYELITQASILGLEYVDAPKFQGVWAEDIEKPEKPEGRRDTYDGRTVTRFTLLKKGIAPLAPGTITIPPATVRLSVRGEADPFIDPFSFMRPQVIERSTKPIAIKVLPIPGHPDFKGPVGKFDLQASLDRTRVKEGEAVTLKVRMSGTGNLRTSVEPPKLEIEGARVYQPTAKNSTSRSSGRPTAQTDWSYVVVPTRSGQLVVPPVRIEVFDTAEKRVVEKRTAPIPVTVEGISSLGAAIAQGGAADTIPAPEAAKPPVPGKALEAQAPSPAPPVRAAASADSGSVDLKHGTVTIPLWAILGIPGGLLIAGGAALAIRTRLRARGEIAEALAGEPGEPKERAASRIDRALRTLLQRRFGIPESAPTATILEGLETAGVATEARAAVEALLSELDFLRFAPQLGEYGEKIEGARRQAARVFRQLG